VTKDRLPVFKTDKVKTVKAIDEARASGGFLLFAYVIMVDHLHAITSKPGTAADVLRILKSLTARRVIDYLRSHGYLSSLAKLEHLERKRKHKYSLWQTEKNAFPIFTEEMFVQKVNYIHSNPVQARFVDHPNDYRWSSARIWRHCPWEDELLRVDVDKIRRRRKG
jgi:REP element-mobilizing transposase RayT